MPNYLETTVPGETRRRAHQLMINNQEGTVPTVVINTQDRINLVGGAHEYVSRPSILAVFDEVGLTETLPLINADTGAPLGGEMSGLELMVAVQSWVLFKMMQSDTPAPAPEPETPEGG